jgi:hypothetical protein
MTHVVEWSRRRRWEHSERGGVLGSDEGVGGIGRGGHNGVAVGGLTVRLRCVSLI